jgi:hypothetical protein
MIVMHIQHLAKKEPTLTANANLKTTTETELYGFSVEELRKEMVQQDLYHYTAGPFKIRGNITQNNKNSNLEEYIEVDETLFPDMTLDNCWYIMRASKVEEAVRYGGAKFRVYQRLYLKDHYKTVWEAYYE